MYVCAYIYKAYPCNYLYSIAFRNQEFYDWSRRAPLEESRCRMRAPIQNSGVAVNELSSSDHNSDIHQTIRLVAKNQGPCFRPPNVMALRKAPTKRSPIYRNSHLGS